MSSNSGNAPRSSMRSDTYRKPMPRGPRRNLRPVAARKSHRSAFTSIAICPTVWQASTRYGTPSSAQTSPTARASCTSPELVGTHDRATSRVRGSRARRRTLSGSTPPWEIVGAHGLDAGALRQGQVHQLIRRVVGAGGDDTVAGAEVERGEGLGERDGRVLDERDVPGPRADELRHEGVRLAHAELPLVARLVAADRRLPRQVLHERVEHGARHEPRASVIQVDAVPASGRVATPAVELYGGGGQCVRDHR